MTEQRIADHQEKISDLAEKYLDRAILEGEMFCEGLCNWAINKAEQELGSAA